MEFAMRAFWIPQSTSRFRLSLVRIYTLLCLNAKAGKEKIIVCKAIQDIMDKSKQEGRAEGEQTQAKSTVLRMYAKGKSLDEIADDVGFDVETVKGWLSASNS